MNYSVQITGPALSFLYFSVSSGLKEGFLIGTFEENQVETISDSSENSVRQNTLIRVSGVFPCSQTSKLFDQLEDAMLIPKQTVGWFCGRTNCLLKPSFRETAMQVKLAEQFNPDSGKKFIFVLVQNAFNPSNVTREFQAKFFQFDNKKREWSSLVGSILNWNPRASHPNKSPYRSLPTLEPSLLSLFEAQHKNKGLADDKLVEGIITTAHSYLTEALQRTANISCEIAEIEREITKLKIAKVNRANLRKGMGTDRDNVLAEDLVSNNPSPLLASSRSSSRLSTLHIEETNDTSASSLPSSTLHGSFVQSASPSNTSSQEY